MSRNLGHVVILVLFFGTIGIQCRRDAFPERRSYRPKCLSYECAARHLPVYDAFIRHLIDRGFGFDDFSRYWDVDRFAKGQNLIIIRHDVHRRDITDAYYASVIEQHLIGKHAATYFVMLDFPREMVMDEYSGFRRGYLELIAYLDSINVDVQPHISITDMYVSSCRPWWGDLQESELKALFEANYQIIHGAECDELEIVGTDCMNLKRMNDSIPVLLKRYNNNWAKQTGLEVLYYASHGSPSPFNHVFNNQDVMNQCGLIQDGLYFFDTYNTRIAHDLNYLSDNNLPMWMDEPETIEMGRYQFLMHPRLWENPDSCRFVATH